MSRLPRGRQRRDEPRLPARGTRRVLPADAVALGAPHRGADVLNVGEARRDTGTAKRLAAMLAEELHNRLDGSRTGPVRRAYRRADVTAATDNLDGNCFPEAGDDHRDFGRRDTSLDFNAVSTEARSSGQ